MCSFQWPGPEEGSAGKGNRPEEQSPNSGQNSQQVLEEPQGPTCVTVGSQQLGESGSQDPQRKKGLEEADSDPGAHPQVVGRSTRIERKTSPQHKNRSQAQVLNPGQGAPF